MSRRNDGFRGKLEPTTALDDPPTHPDDVDPVQLQQKLAEFYLNQAGFKATPLPAETLGGRRYAPPPSVRPDAGLARLCTVQAAQLAVLAGTAEALANNETPNGVSREVLTTCLDLAAISHGVLYVVDAPGTLRLAETVGFDPAALRRLQACFGHMDPLLRLLSDRRVETLPSERVDARISNDLLDAFGVASMLVVPVIWGGALQGMLLLGAPRTDASAEESVAFARVLGLQVAQSIALARAFDRTTQAERRYRALMEGAHDAVAVMTPDGRILEVNRRWEELLLLPRSRIEGRHIREFAVAQSESRHVGDFLTALEGPRSSEFAFALRREDGVTLLMEISSAVLEIAGERLVLAIGRDVTEQVRGRAQRMLSDRLASVGMLASGVAHEINNPLAAVVTNLELASQQLAALARRYGPLGDLEEEIADARGAAERVRLIVKDLATFAREDEGGSGPVDIQEILESALRMVRNEVRHRATVTRRYRDVPWVIGNDSRFGQVFLNLLVNAAHAIPEGRADSNGIDVFLDTDPDGWVVVEVRDTGCGMSPEVLGQLFTPFFTTRRTGEGTGLGLAISQRIVADAGGEITVTSEVGHGSVVRVRLPPAEAPTEAEVPAAPPARARVLLVDDDPLVMRSLQRFLADTYEVTACADAGSALALVASGIRFDLVVSDLIMPRMTGMDLHAALSETAPDQAARMVFLSGGAFTDGARAFLDGVPNPNLEKPIDGKVLKACLQERLSTFGPAARLGG